MPTSVCQWVCQWGCHWLTIELFSVVIISICNVSVCMRGSESEGVSGGMGMGVAVID